MFPNFSGLFFLYVCCWRKKKEKITIRYDLLQLHPGSREPARSNGYATRRHRSTLDMEAE